jgi:hypothetical protein
MNDLNITNNQIKKINSIETIIDKDSNRTYSIISPMGRVFGNTKEEIAEKLYKDIKPLFEMLLTNSSQRNKIGPYGCVNDTIIKEYSSMIMKAYNVNNKDEMFRVDIPKHMKEIMIYANRLKIN